MTPRTLTQQHRAQQLLLRRATVMQVEKAWSVLDYADLDGTFPNLASLTARIVEVNRQTSAGVAGKYLRQFRTASGIKGQFPVDFVSSLVAEQFGISLRATSIAAIKKATTENVVPAVAMSNALTQTSGSMARLVLNAGRETIAQTVLTDPRALGYQRVLGGPGCAFCQMLASRGAVYGADSADFEAHDHCGCTAEPVYES